MESLEERDLFEIGQECIDHQGITIRGNLTSFHQACDLAPLLKLTLGCSSNGDEDDVERKIYDKALKYVGEIGVENKKHNSERKRMMMKLRRDGFDASLYRSSWCATKDYPGGEYEFIDIILRDSNGNISSKVIIDIDFKSQFELARPAETYANLFSGLPSIFVGSEEKLKKLITLLCTAMYQSFTENGLHVPPWRTSSYMQLKWLSCCNKTLVFPYPMCLMNK